jgi:uncharacterized protein
MKISIQVKPKSRENSVELQTDGSYLVRVTALPTDGEANEAVIDELAGYFDVPKTKVTIKSGHGSRRKIVEILD